MRKRFLSLALALVLCMGLTVPAMAAVTVTEIAAPGVYQELSDYSDGLMVVKKNDNGVWYSAAIDTKGKEVIPAGSYDILSGFSGGMAQVNGQNGVGYIDKTGKLAVPCEYGRTSHGFSDGMALVYDYEAQKYGFVDQTGALAIPYQYAIYNFFGSKQPDFSDGLALIYDTANAGYGYIDKTGKTVIPCQYSDARAFAGCL